MARPRAPKHRSRAPDAAQRRFDDALQSRGPCGSAFCGLLGPGSAQQRKNAAARPGHERGEHSPHTPSLRGALATKQSRLPPRWQSGLLPPLPRLRRTSRSARNDDVEAAVPTSTTLVPRTQRSVPSTVRCRAGAYSSTSAAACWVMALRSSVGTLQRVPETEASNSLRGICADATKHAKQHPRHEKAPVGGGRFL